MRRFTLAALLALAATSSYAQQWVTVFDSMTAPGGTTFTGSTPRNLMAMGFNLGNVDAGPVMIYGMDFAFTSATAASYTQLRFDISFFGTSNNNTSGTGPAFSNLIATRTVVTGAMTTAANTSYLFQHANTGLEPGIVFGTPFELPSTTNLGVQMLVQADQGNGLFLTQDLTFRIRRNSAFAVGSGTTNGFYRNASQPNPTDATTPLLGSDWRTFSGSTDIGLNMRLYSQSAVPEPASIAVLGLGAVALLRRRRKG